ncbi:hypothetical protein Vadar_015365 [Vaccinium darrowii]|uniref:Uncharacterized protein n=1 Tax=Vaccinium darrowii TaxID=229202 RepID=A0ACB7YN40_9ERIC|nr:hypothetical protein Vadar_015365 [Vaccinium darrowii]
MVKLICIWRISLSEFDSQLLISFTSSLYVAGLTASFFASSITKAFGHKPSILLGGNTFFYRCSCQCLHTNLWPCLAWCCGWLCESVSQFLSGMAHQDTKVQSTMASSSAWALVFFQQTSLTMELGASVFIEKERRLVKAMAVGMSITSEGGEYNGRITSFVVLSCMMAATGGILFGYDIGISGGVTSMEPFLKRFFPEVYSKMKEDTKISNYCKYDSQLLTLFTSSLYVAGLIASFFASSVTIAFGRRPSILVGGVAFLAGSVLGGAAFNLYTLIFGRLLLGVGVGFANQSVPLYLSEMAPCRHRGAINNGFHLSLGIGVLSANLINYGTEKIKGGWGWRVSLAMGAVPAAILTLGSLFLSETPISLIQRSKNHQKAKLLLQRVRGTEDVQAELLDLIKANEMCITIKNPFWKILETKYRPQFVMAIAIPFFQQVTGINVVGFYAPVIFRTIGLGESAALMSTIATGVVGLCGTFISMLIVDKFGRRVLLMVGGIQMFISQIIVGSIMATKLGDHGGLSKVSGFVVLIFICTYVLGFCLSWGSLGFLIPSEIFPLEIRSAGQSITVAVSLLFTFIIAQTFLAMLCHFKSGSFFFFGGWIAVMTVFVYLYLPETKSVPIEQMDRVWREHWFWKRIVGEEHEVSKMEEKE